MSRIFALGDPQAPFSQFLGVLRAADVIDRHDALHADVTFLSMGDHFDFRPREGQTRQDVGREGLKTLRWLLDQPTEQVQILCGNHDSARVMELATLSDADFDLAQTLAEPELFTRYPTLASTGIVQRDLCSFLVAQRALVQEALLSGRMRLATVVRTSSGREVLATHAGVTTRELDLLGLPRTRDPHVLANALNTLLHERLDRVRPAWSRQELAPLDLSPLHLPGRSGEEGGGLMYHRPQTTPPDDWSTRGRRRYHPRELPTGLLQLCGHTHHHKMTRLLPERAKAVPDDGHVRTLLYRAGTDEVVYHSGAYEPGADEGAMWMIDGWMSERDHARPLQLAGCTPWDPVVRT
jgi:hypothetical protein